EAESGDDDVAAIGRRRGERHERVVDAEERAELLPYLPAERQRGVGEGLARARLAELAVECRSHRLRRRDRERTVGACVQVGVALEYRKRRTGLLEGHTSILSSTGAWSESSRPFCRRRSSGQTRSGPASAPRTSTWSIPGPAGEKSASSGRVLKSPARTSGSPGRARPSNHSTARAISGSAPIDPADEAWRFATTMRPSTRTAWQMRGSTPLGLIRSAPRCSVERSGDARIAFPCPDTADRITL